MSRFCHLCGKPLDPMTYRCLQCAAPSSETDQNAETQEELLKRQVAAKAKQAVSVAAVSGNVAKRAFLSTISGATTPGEKAVVFGSLAGLVAFFLPWFTLFGVLSGTGVRLALDGSGWFWLYPASMICCFFLAHLQLNGSSQRRILAARWFIVVGTLWFAPGLIAASTVFSGPVGIGFYLATAAAGALLLGGLLQIGHEVQRLYQARA